MSRRQTSGHRLQGTRTAGRGETTCSLKPAASGLLRWPTRPRRREHDFLGPVQVWPAAGGEYCVKRFGKCSGRYLAMQRVELMGGIWALLGRHKTLRAAQATCERRARGLFTTEAQRARR